MLTYLLTFLLTLAPRRPEYLENSEIRVGTCEHPAGGTPDQILDTIRLNSICQGPINSAEISDNEPIWIVRECDTNYYGQYIYILRETPEARFSLSEVEESGKQRKILLYSG